MRYIRKIKRKVAFLLLPCVLAFCSYTFVDVCQIHAMEEQTIFAKEDGSEENPYIIMDKYQLDAIRNDLSAHYKLGCDIEFAKEDFEAGGDFYNDGIGFETIGAGKTMLENFTIERSVGTACFSGSLDGDGHRIKGFFQRAEYDIYVEEYRTEFGLFAKGSDDAVIKNLRMEDIDIQIKTSRKINCGGLASLFDGKIENCSVDGKIIVDMTDVLNYQLARVGGIAAQNYGTSAGTENCSSDADITFYQRDEKTGDEVGSPSGNAVAGICALSNKVIDSHNTGNISVIGSSCGVAGITAGGCAERCYNTGNISFEFGDWSKYYSSEWNMVGGIIAGSGTEIKNCYNTGNITGFDSVGGIVGQQTNSVESIVKNCYNTGIIKKVIWRHDNFTYSGAEGFGTLVGQEKFSNGKTLRITMDNSYYLNNDDWNPIGIQKGRVGNVTGLTEDELRLQEKFVGFDFDSVWAIDESTGYFYPYLRKNPHMEREVIALPTDSPTPTEEPTKKPTISPTPTEEPTSEPIVIEPTETARVEPAETEEPTKEPTISPTPTEEPTSEPIVIEPTETARVEPAKTEEPAKEPTDSPTQTEEPTKEPTISPTPTEEPTSEPVVIEPTETARVEPAETEEPVKEPTDSPILTVEPTISPSPTEEPTVNPTLTQEPMPTPMTEVSPSVDYFTRNEGGGDFSFAVRDNGKEQIVISWNQEDIKGNVLLFRAVKKNGKYKKLTILRKKKYIDKTVKAGTAYYYKLGSEGSSVYTAVKKVTVHLMTPKVKVIKKKTADGQKYFQIILKKWSGNRIELSARTEKSQYKKIKIKSDKLSRKKHIYNISYTQEKKRFYFRIRTWNKSKKKKCYSRAVEQRA